VRNIPIKARRSPVQVRLARVTIRRKIMTNATPAAMASDGVRALARRLAAQHGFVDAVAALSRGDDVTWDGVWGSSCALVAAALVERVAGTLVVVGPRADDTDEFCDDLALFSEVPAERFPAWEADAGERILYDEIYCDRLRTLKRLIDAAPAGPDGGPAAQAAVPKLIATSIQSLLQPTPDKSQLAAASRRIPRGSRVDVQALLTWLVEGGFHPTSAIELPGEFARRGGILDIFAFDWDQPVRIEFFGDEVDSIRRFDVASQRSLESLESIEITILGASSADRAHFSDYLPPHSVFLLIEPDLIDEESQHYLQRLERPGEFHTLPDVLREIRRFPLASASGLAHGELGTTCHLQLESVERFSGEIERVRSELDRVGAGHEVFVVVQTEAELERLAEILRSTQLASAGRLHFPLGSLRQGFRFAAEQAIVITAGELFCRGELRRIPRRRLGKAIDSFLDLREGDLVVHLSHGIARYRGLQLLDKDGHVEEHLQLEFDGSTKIYVPASKIGLVQKYVGGAKTRPTLAKIGGKTWVRQKRAAEAAVVDLAAEMLDMQAARAARPGIAFVTDSEWQREFDASFPYQETTDQLAALECIRQDMQAPRPMDRLLCGDVGFGKTEIAMRAAFKAVDNGYQVAVLAPTTVLVEQHFHTFRDRTAEFPFDIAKLSRFCSSAEQRQAIRGLAAGQIDIVIGTHRLASQDVQFHNLGLLIIDEEQRFGVEVKERLKALRATVDVLTLTATPIPRTLHMSLVGLRDISNLETPPEDRLAVETRLTRFNHELIRHAVLRELNRGGQIYFVHNRVADIRVIEQILKQIVPEARIRVGHGQMPEDALEAVMVDFVAGKFDLLLATTIVESGLDIPNANTIFIDEADRYGLADLHQLRGRVGRYKHRAYCYLLVDPHKHVTPNAARRLRAIEEFSELGAGFALAMRDLEIRGAGNLLGTQQSGHIAAVGYELYCEMLENAVRRLKQMPPRLSIEVEVDLPGTAFLPDDYVSDLRLKIDLYRRLARLTQAGQVQEFHAELTDRFGPPPAPVQRMLSLAELKIDAAIWQIAEVYREDHFLVFRYTDRRRVEQLAKAGGGKLRIVDERYAYLPLSQGISDSDELLKTVKSVLRLR
jgi:transcription-repair coupling factor (superfamily II helicase)